MMSKLISKHSKALKAVEEATGHYDYENGGVWVEGTPSTTDFRGALLPLNKKDKQFDANGTYTVEDRKLYTSLKLKIDDKIQDDKIEYTVNEIELYEELAGFNIYYLKRVSKS